MRYIMNRVLLSGACTGCVPAPNGHARIAISQRVLGCKSVDMVCNTSAPCEDRGK